ncbi:MAG: hypothetical protein JRJ86_16620 [Deltaproteobacteria bacterium]|nr:hypothetical protein [Deltaproteobacteria bacterium]MBW2116681.1 hypothetical protein [Deltaproteobacteria bacterium]MBW2342989.1 hypothetical protein [Deltaproteobacteria bacterium]
MVISAYQVNNVLRVYGDQLRQGRFSIRPKTANTRLPDMVSISAGAKRKAVIDKVASNVIEKIAQYGPQENVEKEVFQKLENEYGAQLAISRKSPTDLIFKAIDEDGETINLLSIEDSKFLRHKLEEITKETVNKNMM